MGKKIKQKPKKQGRGPQPAAHLLKTRSPIDSKQQRLPPQFWERAVGLFKESRFSSCIEQCQQILLHQSDHAYALNLIGIAFGASGQPEKGLAYVKSAIAIRPHDVSMFENLAMLQQKTGDLMGSLETLKEACSIAPNHPKLLFSLANLQMRRGHNSDAISLFEQVRPLLPNNPDVLNNLGLAYKKDGQPQKALAQFDEAVRLAPKQVGYVVNLANLCSEQRLLAEADSVFLLGLQRSPESAELHHAYGKHLLRNASYDKAQGVLARAFELLGEHPAVSASEEAAQSARPASIACDLALALSKSGKLEEALQWVHRARKREPQLADVYYVLGYLYRHMGCHKEAKEALDQYGALTDDQSAHLRDRLMMSIYDHDISPTELFNLSQEHARHLAGQIPASSRHGLAGMPAPSPLRVGFISRDFRAHVVSQFIIPLFETLPHYGTEIFCYHDHMVEDDVSENIKTLVHSWCNSKPLSDDELRARIRKDNIHILIDLNVFADSSRFQIFARRAAPVQATYLGWVYTSGLPTMDFRLTDPILNDEGRSDRFYTERPAYLPSGFCCYGSPKNCPDVQPLPFLKNRFFTFGSFNDIAKMTDATLALWADVLNSVSDSILFLKNSGFDHPSVKRRVELLFEQNGVSKDRLRFQGYTASHEAHLALYHDIDIALDTVPYNSGTTFCDAAFMGVPTLTKTGPLAHSRMSASFLSTLKIDGYSADSRDDFVRRALDITANPADLNDLRLGLRALMTDSPLMDPNRMGREFSAALRDMWHQCHQEHHSSATFETHTPL